MAEARRKIVAAAFEDDPGRLALAMQGAGSHRHPLQVEQAQQVARAASISLPPAAPPAVRGAGAGAKRTRCLRC